MAYTNSPLVDYKKISPNRGNGSSYSRNHSIDTITIHCVVGQCTVETLGAIFANPQRQASSNYGVGYDGKIGLYCEQKDRSWCTSSYANDNRAVTIEVASDTTDPYAVTQKAYAALIELVADICKRNGIKKLVWSENKDDRINHRNGCNMTVHRDYANKSCPGAYLYSRHADIAKKVNKKLAASDTAEKEVAPPNTPVRKLPEVPFTINVLSKDLVIFSKPAFDSKKNGTTGKGSFTITAVQAGTWGKLKSGAGWVNLASEAMVKIDPVKIAEPKSKLNSLKGAYTVVSASGLNMRNDAGVNNTTILAILPNRTRVQNYGYYTSVDGVKWLYVVATVNKVTYTGYCNSSYLKKA